MACLRAGERFRPARFSKKVSIDIADLNGEDFLRVLRSELRLSERAISRGGSLNTRLSRSSALLCRVTSRDQ